MTNQATDGGVRKQYQVATSSGIYHIRTCFRNAVKAVAIYQSPRPQMILVLTKNAAHYKSCQQRTKVATLKNISIKSKTVTFNCSINCRSIWIFLHVILVSHDIQATGSLPGPTARTVFDPAETCVLPASATTNVGRPILSAASFSLFLIQREVINAL
ncbi:hypothetical protein V8G54_008599 [Vigna mungo]|uniref:Uncharacterized protein n=1 Tax=Vigna mungo TaxID=3915 RepID=A0AAQ3P609_VIGMU